MFMLLVASVLLGLMQGKLLTVLVIAAAAPVAGLPAKAAVHHVAFKWYYNDRDVVRAVMNRERVEVVAENGGFQFDFYGQQTQFRIPAYKLKQEMAKRRKLMRRQSRVVTPDVSPATDSRFFSLADFTVLPDESAAFCSASPSGAFGGNDGMPPASRGGCSQDELPPGSAGGQLLSRTTDGLYLDEIELESSTAGGPSAVRGDDDKPVPLDVTIHTYTQYLGWALGLGSFLMCWASIRAIRDSETAASYCTNGSLNTVFVACVVVDNLICEPLYLAAVYILRNADAVGEDAAERDGSSSSSSDDDGTDSDFTDSDSRSDSVESGSRTSSQRRRARRRAKRRKSLAVFCELHPVEGCLRRIYVHPELDEMFNTVHDRKIDEFTKAQQLAERERSQTAALEGSEVDSVSQPPGDDDLKTEDEREM